MATQKVHNVPYLAVAKIPATQNEAKVALVPKGAHIIHISAEVTEVADNGAKLDLGVEGATDSFTNDIDLTTQGVSIANVAFEAKEDLVVLATIEGSATKGEVIVRVQYYNPSTIKAEI